MPNAIANRPAAPTLQARSKTLPKRLQPGAQPVKIAKPLQVLRGPISGALCKPLGRPLGKPLGRPLGKPLGNDTSKTEATNLLIS